MLVTNLLPSEKRRVIDLEVTRRLLIFLTVGFSAVFLTGAALLLPTFINLYFEENSLNEELKLEKDAFMGNRADETFVSAQSLKSRVSLIVSAVSEDRRASKTLEDFFEDARNGGVTLTSMNIGEEGSFIISGFAPTRKNLLDFEKTLRDSGKFQEINYPLSNILPGANINFTFHGKLKPPHGL